VKQICIETWELNGEEVQIQLVFNKKKDTIGSASNPQLL